MCLASHVLRSCRLMFISLVRDASCVVTLVCVMRLVLSCLIFPHNERRRGEGNVPLLHELVSPANQLEAVDVVELRRNLAPEHVSCATWAAGPGFDVFCGSSCVSEVK